MTTVQSRSTLVARLLAWRYSISRNGLMLAVACWLMLNMNGAFWHTVWNGVGGWGNDSKLFLLSLPLLVTLWLFGLLSLLTWGRASKLILALFLLISAAASYFINTYGILIDSSMLTNVMQTDTAEALDLISARMICWMLLFGLLPVLLLSRAHLLVQPWRRELAYKLAGIVLTLACICGILLSQYQSYSSLLRNHREIRLQLVPSNVVGAVHGYLRRQLASPRTLEVVGADARQLVKTGLHSKPKLTVVVVGETARAMNFSLNGYARQTNPELAQRDVISFSNVSSCGTATATSVPCMFMDMGHDDYRDSLAGHREGLLDVLQRAGVSVLWRDNNSGCKGSCDRTPSEDVSHFALPDICADNECHDEVLLSGLQKYLDTQYHDAVVVLHMKGSHGPAYYKRYPKAFERFTPVCESSQLDKCSVASIVNAYDNTLLYTDHVLAQVIDLLKNNQSRFDSAMLYASDHGESLGEKGIYLHGLPYAMAPEEQTHIPMVLWMSPQLASRAGITPGCLEGQRDVPLSHDNIFHSVVGLMGVQTSVYKPERDLFRACTPPAEQMALSEEQ